ncbi:hypothetical protein DERF_005476 [Dermatophagoides farinae]|uniref:Uncharacterized protein n=1 Tax=Dermatophagoides farinae TaxID=6954 RepID=A0A922I5F0_DERFA|nr:hypothetical protein DERF_005476 [Dermatophagoides farinae]
MSTASGNVVNLVFDHHHPLSGLMSMNPLCYTIGPAACQCVMFVRFATAIMFSFFVWYNCVESINLVRDREDASGAKLIDSSINRRTNECHNCLSHCSSLISEYRILVLFVCNLQWIGWWPSQHHHHSPYTMIILKVCMILALSNLSSTLLVSEPLLYAGDIIAIDNKR